MNESIQTILRDQRTAWEHGQRPLVESFIERYPFLLKDQNSLLDLICSEYFLRFDFGDRVEVDTFCLRFPAHAEKVKQLLQLTSLFCISSSGSSMTECSTSTVIEINQNPRIPGIRFVRFIAKGTWGVVFEGIQERLSRRVAVKVLQRISKVASQEEFLLHESKALAKLNHPNVVQIYDSGVYQGHHYIVMELVEGITLKTYLSKKGPLPVEEALELIAEVAEGIAAAHQSDVIHRDLKPANILLAAKNKPKIVDFGLARLDDNSRVSTVDGTIGTVGYMAPEQLNSSLASSKAADIFSIGVIFHEMLTGDLPKFESLNKSNNFNKRHLSSISSFSKDITKLLDISLELNSNQRCESASKIRELCKDILERKTTSKFKRRQFIKNAVALVSVPLIASGIYQVIRPRRKSSNEIREEIRKHLLNGNEYAFQYDEHHPMPFAWRESKVNAKGNLDVDIKSGELLVGSVGKGYLELLDNIPITQYQLSANIQIQKSAFLDPPYAGVYWGFTNDLTGYISSITSEYTERTFSKNKVSFPRINLYVDYQGEHNHLTNLLCKGKLFEVSNDLQSSKRNIGFVLSDSQMSLLWSPSYQEASNQDCIISLSQIQQQQDDAAKGSLCRINVQSSTGLFFENCNARVSNILIKPI